MGWRRKEKGERRKEKGERRKEKGKRKKEKGKRKKEKGKRKKEKGKRKKKKKKLRGNLLYTLFRGEKHEACLIHQTQREFPLLQLSQLRPLGGRKGERKNKILRM